MPEKLVYRTREEIADEQIRAAAVGQKIVVGMCYEQLAMHDEIRRLKKELSWAMSELIKRTV